MDGLINLIFLVATGAIAVHALRGGRRRSDNDAEPEPREREIVRLLFGAIAALFFFLVLFKDVLGVLRF